jgi:hypothetical protein
VEKLDFSRPAHSGTVTGVQKVREASKTPDSGFRPHDLEKDQFVLRTVKIFTGSLNKIEEFPRRIKKCNNFKGLYY